MYDVIIIGGGIIGAATAYELSRYDLKIAVLEKDNDVANGTTKANSAILHSGFDAAAGSLAAKLNVQGVRMAKDLCQKLDVERREIPTFVLAFTDEDLETLQVLYERGQKNGVPGMKIISGDEARALEKNLSPDVLGALHVTSSAIVNPWEFAIALAETAVKNGAEVHLSTNVTGIDKQNDAFTLHTNQGDFCAKYVVNAAGAYAATVHEMVGGHDFTPMHTCGEYYVLDKNQGSIINSIVFPCPTKAGKGILVAPTVHGNLIVGPDAFAVKGADDVATDPERLHRLQEAGHRSVPAIDFRQIIHEYAGVRPNTDNPDFIIEESPACKDFINLAGIRSPGLSAAPAIGVTGVELLEKCGLKLRKKTQFIDTRTRIKFRELSDEQRQKVVAENPLYGHIVCRCETVTEGEIVEAIHRPIVPRSIDAIKRRCNAGMGRCQGGFCGPLVHGILARELGVAYEDILLDEEGSYIVTGKTKEAAR